MPVVRDSSCIHKYLNHFEDTRSPRMFVYVEGILARGTVFHQRPTGSYQNSSVEVEVLGKSFRLRIPACKLLLGLTQRSRQVKRKSILLVVRQKRKAKKPKKTAKRTIQ